MIIFFCSLLFLHFSLYTSQEMIIFKLTGNQFDKNNTITTYRKVAQKFENFQHMLADIPQDAHLPFETTTSETHTLSQEEIKKSINYLLSFVTAKLNLPLIRSKIDIIIEDPTFIYKQASLQNIKLGLSYAVKDKLDETILTDIANIYIEKLLNTDFTKLGTVQNQLNSLPYDPEVDKLITLRVLEIILLKKYPARVPQFLDSETDYYPSGDSHIGQENPTLQFKRLSKEFKLNKPTDIFRLAPPTLSILQPLKKKLCFWDSSGKMNINTIDNHPTLIVFSTNSSTRIDIRSNGTIRSYTPVTIPFFSLLFSVTPNENIYSIPSFREAKSGALDFNKQGMWCAGCNKSIALFTIDPLYGIKDVQTYEIRTKTEGYITHISMLDNSIAITFKSISGEYEYHFFDITIGTFIKDNPNKVEMIYYTPDMKTKEVVKKQMFLLRDTQNFINSATILKARGFTESHFYYDMVLDERCENIYAIYKIDKNDTSFVYPRIIPLSLTPFINSINQIVKEKSVAEESSLLTLCMIYCISIKFHDLAPNMIISNELTQKVPIAIRTLINPTLFNRLVNKILLRNNNTSWLDGIAILGGLGLAGLLWYNLNRTTSTLSELPATKFIIPLPSAAYAKIAPLQSKALHK